MSRLTPRRSGSSEAKVEVTLTSPKPRKLSYGSATRKLYSSRSAMGFLQRAAMTRSSTPSPSRSPVNCGYWGSTEQLSPNCLCTYSSVIAGDGVCACAGGGGGNFFCAAKVADPAESTSKTRTERLRNRGHDMLLLYPR